MELGDYGNNFAKKLPQAKQGNEFRRRLQNYSNNNFMFLSYGKTRFWLHLRDQLFKQLISHREFIIMYTYRKTKTRKYY